MWHHITLTAIDMFSTFEQNLEEVYVRHVIEIASTECQTWCCQCTGRSLLAAQTCWQTLSCSRGSLVAQSRPCTSTPVDCSAEDSQSARHAVYTDTMHCHLRVIMHHLWSNDKKNGISETCIEKQPTNGYIAMMKMTYPAYVSCSTTVHSQ